MSLSEKLKKYADKVKHKPRKYQLKAAGIALDRERAVIVLPTGTGKTLVGLLWAKTLLGERKARKILVLEPTRILVEQTAEYFRRIGNIDAKAIHGLVSKKIKESDWFSKVIVTTPEEMLFHEEKLDQFDAIIVDECHHSVGNDAFKKVLEKSTAAWRLGLSAHIPSRHKKTIEGLIGKIHEWSISDPEISPYIPDWIGEIYEAPLDSETFEVYKDIEARWMLSERRERNLYALALRFLSRDGALALKESVSKETKLAELLSPLKERILKLPDLHKLEKLKLVLEQHDFEKMIIFVDRVIVAKRLFEELKEYHPVLIIGRRKGIKDAMLKQALREARLKESRIVISTSAGEEGVDLPSADLLVIWSNVVSPLRFIQRHGRILRKTKPLKYVVYIVTPDTVDMNAFLDSVDYAKKAGVDVPVDKSLIEKLRKKSPRTFLLDILERPLPLDWIAEISGLTKSEAERAINMFLKDGKLLYVYTSLGRTILKHEQLSLVEEEYSDYFSPNADVEANVKVLTSDGKRRNIGGRFNEVKERLSKMLEKHGINSLSITIREVRNYIEYIYTLRYNFKIVDGHVLITVLKNAFTPETYRTYG